MLILAPRTKRAKKQIEEEEEEPVAEEEEEEEEEPAKAEVCFVSLNGINEH